MAKSPLAQISELIAELTEQYTSAFSEAARLHCSDWPDDDGQTNALEGLRQTFRLANAGHLMHLEGDPCISSADQEPITAEANAIAIGRRRLSLGTDSWRLYLPYPGEPRLSPYFSSGGLFWMQQPLSRLQDRQ